ncbi:MAG: TMEM165/GDT1 family protein, partial [Actinomycetota bacterium]|nr:TMEM165/GDT1 family protein [Actinomycetota bacterium]
EFLKGLGPAFSARMASVGLVPTTDLPVAVRFWGVTLGSTVGMVLADALAIGVGRLLGKRLPETALTRVSGFAFIAFGLVTMAAPYFTG